MIFQCLYKQSDTSSDLPAPQATRLTPTLSTPAAEPGVDVPAAESPDGERIRVLNQLLQQLESRRAEREK